jgi:hypothetical protein
VGSDGRTCGDRRGEVSDEEPAVGQPPRYVIEVGLVEGGTVEGEPGDGTVTGSLGDLDRRLSTDSFEAVDERLVVRSSDVRFLRLREADGSSSGLLDTIKERSGEHR